MKKSVLFMAILAAIAVLAGCNKTGDDPASDNPEEIEEVTEEIQARPIELTYAETRVGKSVNGFGLDVFRKLQAEGQQKDLLFSPFSLSLDFALCAGGGEAETKNQILKTLGFAEKKAEDVAGYYKKMVEGLVTVDPSTKFLSANSVWVHKAYSLRDSFKDYASDYFNADLVSLDLLKKESLAQINRWCASHTEGMIEKVVDDSRDPDAAAVSYLLNALYFKSGWSIPFEEKTQEGIFHGVSGDRTATFLQKEAKYGYYEKENAQFVMVPYGNGSYFLVIALPKEGVSLSGMMDSLSENDFFVNDLRDPVRLRLPKFDIEYNTGDLLIPVLQGMGMTAPFNSTQADFSAMFTDKTPFCINQVLQKAVISVDEKGTEASAVTVIGMAMSNGEPYTPVLRTVTVDRPFAFALVEFSSRTILFLGQKMQ